MRSLLACVLFLALTASLSGLQAQEKSTDWLQLFDGETTFGWHIDGEAKVEKGKLILGGGKATKAHVTISLSDFDIEYTFTNPDGVEQTTKVQHDPHGKTRAALAFDLAAGKTVILHSAKCRPANLVSLFNGKDLTGWKVFKGNPKQEVSKWTVTKEGWLNVKDGPGDLQTEKQFANFVVQLECISNGKHLNSGLFFRCQPDKYQQGYEAQIRNQFKEQATEKYTIEEYDPKTNKLTGKRTVLSTAFDFGTGAIYRRVPARKGVSKDNEWFTLTVVANGRHIATWVNGVQVVDWTDNRPESDNARQGYRSAAGALSIQGHDPTTDLSFRNIRAGELAGRK